jgi:D-psicose/D-tagatose/L-ribulose 3-epimerase
MNLLGLHASAIAPAWDPGRVEPQMERLGEHGVGLFEIPLLRPAGIDARRARAFASRWGVELFASLALPQALDIVERPQEGLDFLEPAFRVCADLGSFGLGGMTYGAIGRTAGRPPTQKEIDGVCRFLERAARAARTHGLKLGVEPCNRYETHLINRARDAANIVERVGAENIFIHLDTAHMHIEEESFAAGFEAAAPFLGYVQASEGNRGVPGRGMLNWLAAFKALAAIGYSGPITLESLSHAEVAGRPDEVIDEGLPFLKEKAREAGLTL